MKILSSISEEYIVSQFLKAEIDSPRFGNHILHILQKSGHDRCVIDSPDLSNDEENRLRASILGLTRGYGFNKWLFTRFPKNVTWNKATFSYDELTQLRLLHSSPWTDISRGSCLASDIAKSIHAYAEAPHVLAVIQKIKMGLVLPEVILVKNDGADDFVVMEGCIRTLAYIIAHEENKNYDAILGSSPEMSSWEFFGSRNQ